MDGYGGSDVFYDKINLIPAIEENTGLSYLCDAAHCK
jgi:hypothetical protein